MIYNHNHNHNHNHNNILILPKELFIEIFSFHSNSNIYISLQLTCKFIYHSLNCEYARFLLINGKSWKSRNLDLLKNDVDIKKLYSWKSYAPNHLYVENGIINENKGKLFSLGIVYDIEKGDMMINDDDKEIYIIENVKCRREKVKKREFRRDKIIELNVCKYSNRSRKKKIIKRGNDLINICKERNEMFKTQRYKVDCISTEDKIYLSDSSTNSNIIIDLPNDQFGKCIKEIEEFVNIYLYKKGLKLFLIILIFELDGQFMYEVIDYLILKRRKRKKKKKG